MPMRISARSSLMRLPLRTTRLDRGVEKTIATLNQVFQPLGKACGRSAVDRLVIKAERQTQIFADGNLPVNDPRLLADAAHRNPEGMGGEWDSPSGPFPNIPTVVRPTVPRYFF